MQMQQPACIYGNCHRCGAPKAPVMIGGGATMILCTRCSSAEDQEAQRRTIEFAASLNGQTVAEEKK